MNNLRQTKGVTKFLISILFLFLLSFGSAIVVNASSSMPLSSGNRSYASCDPSIAFTSIPPYGATPPFAKDKHNRLFGQVYCLDTPNLFKMAVYIYTEGGWWIKPRWDNPITPIDESLTPITINSKKERVWQTMVYTCCVDHLATKYAAFLVPNGTKVPQLGGEPDLPPELFNYPYLMADRTPIAPPMLVSPANATHQLTLRPTFDWDDVPDALGYNIQIARDDKFKQNILNVNIVDSTYKPATDLPRNIALYWRVRALIGDAYRNWSEVRSFTTGNPPSAPVLLSPANNTTIKGYQPVFKWRAVTVPTNTFFDHYHIQVAADSNFSNLVVDEDVVPPQFTPPNELLPGTRYYWRVSAYNTAGEYSAWSSPWNFRTSSNIFDNGIWWIKKLPPSSPDDVNQEAMSVFVNGVDWGKTYRLDFGHLKSKGSYPATAVIYNTGYVRLTPLGLPFGTSFILGPAHWDNADNYFHNLQISRIDINTSGAKPSGPLKITITARDYNPTLWPSYHFDVIHQIMLPDPKTNKTTMSVTQTYTAAANLDISAARQTTHEGLKVAQFSSMYIDSNYHDSDGVQYTDVNKMEGLVWFKDLLCDNFIFNTPLSLDNRNPWAQLFHSDNDGWQGNTPNTLIWLATPNLAAQTVPQGYWACSTNENNDNVGLWLNDDTASSFSSGQSNVVNYLLISQDDPAPSAPGLALPENNGTVPTNRPTFEWKSVAWANSYTLQISKNGNFSSLIKNVNVASTTYTLPTDLGHNTKYYWRVRSSGPGGTSDWSDIWSFTTGNPPSAPVLVSPADNAMVDYTPFLNWNNSTNPAGTAFLHYQIQADGDADFSSPIIDEHTADGDIADSDFTPVTDLSSNTKYYWRVRAINMVGGEQHQSGWATRSFRAIPLPPTLILPANGSVVDSTKPVFDWEVPSGPGKINSYVIQVSSSPTFSKLLVNSSTVDSTYMPIASLFNCANTYYWRVKALGENGTTNWSEVRHFTVNPEACAYGHLYTVMDVYKISRNGKSLRWLESYKGTTDGDIGWTYDNALAMIALMDRGTDEDWGRAKYLADTFVYLQDNDPLKDGRLRDAYRSSNLARAANQSSTGNMAWATLALLRYYEQKGGDEYLSAAEKLGQWMFDNTYDERGDGGYTGGYAANLTKYMWKGTEHNIDVYIAFMKLNEATGDAIWQTRGMHAKGFVAAMWNDAVAPGHFWTGTLEDGATINTNPIPQDAQSWGLIALGEVSKYGQALTWAENNLTVNSCPGCTTCSGFKFSNTGAGCWWEGVSHMVLGFQTIGDDDDAEKYLNELEKVQTTVANNNGSGIVAACPGGAVTGYNWTAPNALHIGATAWFIFAERTYNPLWDIKTDSSIPYDGEY